MSTRKILISCEHADHIIPSKYASLFKGADEDLKSHKGYDPGSMDLAKYTARNLDVPLYYQKVSRLLIEMNRSINAQDLFSKYSSVLPDKDKRELEEKYYFPYRNEVEDKIIEYVNNGDSVLHISFHSFTPSLNNVERLVDIGILCDEKVESELKFANEWKDKLAELFPTLLVMINMPYNGADDGFTTYLRAKYPQEKYLGIELEINQKYIQQPIWADIKKGLVQSLA
ncbi:N-formylglutamate amidohydrolase [Fulvivirga lutea]|uniref:N-formylglutamate amidohydrolase n=1 Tax=Fulvivirga lutea TaxID=2810512 RepID=A0A974WHB1_9BACT|nr:N-formylglutamate amidohydrolase [Fulvivirga lutea]QSE97864.1 N-formylglutamate amidohydrolase [Fulvivirga lutea]